MMQKPTDVNEFRQVLAVIFVAALVNRDNHNPGNGAEHIAEHACDLVAELEKQFTARDWTK
jgi:hypothetical protein